QQRWGRGRRVDPAGDGLHGGLRGGGGRPCGLVVLGVNGRGENHFLGIAGGGRESTQSWREVLLSLKARGMNAPKLAVGDGAMGFWAALEEVYGDTRQQRCWLHKTANILNSVPKSTQAKMKTALHDIWQAETKDAAETAFKRFEETYEAKYPKAVHCLRKDRDELMVFYDFP